VLARPPHPALYVRDDRETPLREGGTESRYPCFYPAVKCNFGNSEINGLTFLEEQARQGWDFWARNLK